MGPELEARFVPAHLFARLHSALSGSERIEHYGCFFTFAAAGAQASPHPPKPEDTGEASTLLVQEWQKAVARKRAIEADLIFEGVHPLYKLGASRFQLLS